MELTKEQIDSLNSLYSNYSTEEWTVVVNKQAPSGILVIVFQHQEDNYYEGYYIFLDGRTQRTSN